MKNKNKIRRLGQNKHNYKKPANSWCELRKVCYYEVTTLKKERIWKNHKEATSGPRDKVRMKIVKRIALNKKREGTQHRKNNHQKHSLFKWRVKVLKKERTMRAMGDLYDFDQQKTEGVRFRKEKEGWKKSQNQANIKRRFEIQKERVQWRE